MQKTNLANHSIDAVSKSGPNSSDADLELAEHHHFKAKQPCKLQIPHPPPNTHLSRQSLIPPPPSPSPVRAMASRRLALNLQHAVRSKAAINAVKSRGLSPLTRGLATPITYGSQTETTTLSNGFTVWKTL